MRKLSLEFQSETRCSSTPMPCVTHNANMCVRNAYMCVQNYIFATRFHVNIFSDSIWCICTMLHRQNPTHSLCEIVLWKWIFVSHKTSVKVVVFFNCVNWQAINPIQKIWGAKEQVVLKGNFIDTVLKDFIMLSIADTLYFTKYLSRQFNRITTMWNECDSIKIY